MGSRVTRLKVVLSICSSALRAVLWVSGPSAPMAMLKDVRTLHDTHGYRECSLPLTLGMQALSHKLAPKEEPDASQFS